MKLSEAMLKGWEIMQKHNLRQICSEYLTATGACALGAAALGVHPDLLSLPSGSRRIYFLLRETFPELNSIIKNGNNTYYLWERIIIKNDNERENIPNIAKWIKDLGF